MRRRLLTSATALAAVLVGLATTGSTSHAATPTGATINTPGQVVSWSGSGLSGSAASKRNQTCAAQPTACDDFTLTINTGTDTHAIILVSVTETGAGTQIVPLLYAPGCSTSPTDTSGCYSVEGLHFSLSQPPSGVYTIRMACKACAASGYTATATYTDTAPQLPPLGDQTPAWASQVLPGSDTSAHGEPGIWSNNSGRVIVNTFGPTVWISTNDGQSWSGPKANIDTTGCPSGDADAVVSFDNAYYADNLCTAGPTNLSYTSKDDGATWSGSTSGLPSPIGTDSDRQWYAPDPVNPGVIYFSYHDLEGPSIHIQKSTDYGKTFVELTPVTVGATNFADTAAGNTSARPLIDPTNPQRLLVFYTSNTAANSLTAPPTNQDFDLRQVNVAETLDGGTTWTNHLVTDFGQTGGFDNTIAHEFSAAAIDSHGNAYIAISLRLGNATQTHIMATELAKGPSALAQTAVAPGAWTRVDQGGLNANVFPSITAGDPGHVDVTWYGSTAQDNNDATATWSELFAQSLTFSAATPVFTQSNVSGAAPMHSADICLAGTLCLVTGGNRNLSDFQSITTDRCGAALIVYDNDAKGAGNTTFAKQTAGTSLLNSVPAGCAVVAAPAQNVPEAGATVALGLTGAGVVAFLVAARRRRRGPAAA